MSQNGKSIQIKFGSVLPAPLQSQDFLHRASGSPGDSIKASVERTNFP